MNASALPTPDVNVPEATVYIGDALRMIRAMPQGSVDAVVCDPPYAIKASRDPGSGHRSDGPEVLCTVCSARDSDPGYDACADCLSELRIAAFSEAPMLGQQSANWHEKARHSRGYADNNNAAFGLWVSLWASECLRLLKPGGHLVAFGGTRTWHRLACGIEDAGFEMRDSLAWLHASGVPKGLDVGRTVRELETSRGAAGRRAPVALDEASVLASATRVPSDPSAPADGVWDGWHTGLKPAHEPIVLARKPVVGSVAENVSTFATGALNVHGTRLGDGRWPTNVFFDEQQATRLLDAFDARGSRAFFVAKPSSRERPKVGGVAHPTVKPLALMRELVRLVTPTGSVVLDPFAGSGTTVEACVLERRRCVAVERDPSYLPLIEARLRRSRLGGSSQFDVGLGGLDVVDATEGPDMLF